MKYTKFRTLIKRKLSLFDEEDFGYDELQELIDEYWYHDII